MKREDLFLAIGEVEESRLLRTELTIQQPSIDSEMEEMHMKRGKPGRVIRNLLTAVILLLVFTACAAPAAMKVYDALKNASVAKSEIKNYKIRLRPGVASTYEFHLYELQLEVDIATEAPETVEQIFMPAAFNDDAFQIMSCNLWETSFSLWLQTEDSENIYFRQSVFSPENKNGDVPVIGYIYTQTEESPVIMRTVYGNVEVLETPDIRTAEKNDEGLVLEFYRRLFWSDGDYMYTITIPADWTQRQTEKIMSDIVVTDIGEVDNAK